MLRWKQFVLYLRTVRGGTSKAHGFDGVPSLTTSGQKVNVGLLYCSTVVKGKHMICAV